MKSSDFEYERITNTRPCWATDWRVESRFKTLGVFGGRSLDNYFADYAKTEVGEKSIAFLGQINLLGLKQH